jgi:outer membrane biosynthesis protein TonB
MSTQPGDRPAGRLKAYFWGFLAILVVAMMCWLMVGGKKKEEAGDPLASNRAARLAAVQVVQKDALTKAGMDGDIARIPIESAMAVALKQLQGLEPAPGKKPVPNSPTEKKQLEEQAAAAPAPAPAPTPAPAPAPTPAPAPAPTPAPAPAPTPAPAPAPTPAPAAADSNPAPIPNPSPAPAAAPAPSGGNDDA